MKRHVVCLLACLGFASGGTAQELTGTLARIAESGVMTIGYVPDAPPMSFDDDKGLQTVYSSGLCRHVANVVKCVTGRDDIELKFVPLIAPEERLNAVRDGTVDIECGATTVTLSRREQVDFSLLTFITGTAVLSLKDKPLNSIEDLTAKTVAVIKGTTTWSELRRFGTSNEYKITLRLIATHAEGMELLNAGKVDGYASDRAMLVGQVFRSADRTRYAITRDVFSLEPYALMLRRGDTNFRLTVDRALASLYRDARVRRLYHDWFGRYGEPMTPLLEAMYEFQAVSD